MRRLVFRLVVALFVLAAFPVKAAEQQDVAGWVKDLRVEALAKGIRAETFDKAFQGFKPIARIIELDRRQPEFTLTFPKYLSRVVPASRVKRGKAKYQENKKLLDVIGKKYGVQPRFIMAFWGVETGFGRHFGGFSVVHSLATLAYDGRRAKFFRNQLHRALRILNQGHISHAQMKGSWAGAMGNFQFMPSSFENFAVDYDGDGKRDIWTNKGDAFASAANYLAKSGWRSDQTWGRAVKLPQGFDSSLVGLKTRKSISDWQALGVRRSDGGDLPKRDLKASIVIAKNSKTEKVGRAYMVYNNYRVTLKWNRSTFFAVAVGTLAERIGN
ncbi:MAG: lytic murein transglycosylase [Rhodospirillaceae bacterium]|jgi:membrane-bound lytic murein transglycosylase B|nr:lytic murein transglycosylase [Rhodospirillaceae bacterium]MBT4939357.1 lytic murein transglycosylase [Rhodospirillaceae bacterium]MBT7267036.1 lytic murein transglycosylase [Rhodospirillaceae bacterium]